MFKRCNLIRSFLFFFYFLKFFMIPDEILFQGLIKEERANLQLNKIKSMLKTHSKVLHEKGNNKSCRTVSSVFALH